MPSLFPVSAFILPDLKRDEALALEAYPDPLSALAAACRAAGLSPAAYARLPNWQGFSGAPWTIGYGYAGREVHPGLNWTTSQADGQLADCVLKVRLGLATALPWGMAMEPIRADCLINMGFNLGVAGLLSFGTFLGLVRKGMYAAAADDLRDHTKWAHQVGKRAERIEMQLRSGVHQ
jgi:lysozyme